jgi:HAD superfamily hydrolase (TIGR01493 family)
VKSPRTPHVILLDLLMATMDSMSVWALAAADHELGLRWRDEVTRAMIEAGRYTPYERLVTDAAGALGLDVAASNRLWAAWPHMRRWPDAAVLDELAVPYAFVTNCSWRLAAMVVEAGGLRPAFTLSAEEAGWYKPRREAYHVACDRFGVSPTDARFVAGAPYDALGADAAGIPTRLVRRRDPDRPLPDRIPVVDTLREAVGAL